MTVGWDVADVVEEIGPAGALQVHVEREILLADAAKAHEVAQNGNAKGKTVLINPANNLH